MILNYNGAQFSYMSWNLFVAKISYISITVRQKQVSSSVDVLGLE